MRKLLGVAAAVLMSSSAFAADMPTKAAVNPLTNWSGSGTFWEVGTYAGMAQSSVNGNNLLLPSLVTSNIDATGGGVEIGLGYIHGNTNVVGFGNWYMLELKGAYQNINGANADAAGSAAFWSRWSSTQDVCVGADLLQAIFSVVGNLGINFPTWSPSLPSNVQVGTPKQCLGGHFREFGLGGQFGGATGTSFGVAPGLTTQWIYPTIGANGQMNGYAIKAWANIDWNVKGLTFDNVFAKGTPLGVTPGVSKGTTYLAGIDFMVPSLFSR
jgi:hypothetical protein